jgi:hypothetical protein
VLRISKILFQLEENLLQRTFSESPESNQSKLTSQAAITGALTRAITNLRGSEQNGWWSYVDAKGPSTEATSWCAVAMHAGAEDSFNASKTTEYLLSAQSKDGGWSTAPNCKVSDWSTAPAVLALRLLNTKQNSNTRAVERAVIEGSNFLFDLRTDFFRSVARLLLFLSQGQSGLDYGRGWPWTKDCTFWVEPTAYSLLALKLPNVPDRQIIRQAIHHASQYLNSHACRGGGWNHGAAYVLKVFAPPYTLTTAEALLALQDEPHSQVTEQALKFIAADNPDANSSLPLAWSILALNAYGREVDHKTSQLLGHQNEDGGFGTNNMATALAILALLAASKNKNLLKMNIVTKSG